MKADETIEKYKARLVINCYRKWECINYFDTYSLVIIIIFIRMILVIAAFGNIEYVKWILKLPLWMEI